MSGSDRLHVFEGHGIRVTWSRRRCIHAAECVRGLPAVFEPGRKPWVIPDAAETERVAEVVRCCPTGALHYERLDGGPPEAVPENALTPARNGPLWVQGQVEVLDERGRLLLRDTRVALCRCGGSDNKPFCDGSHRLIGFRDAGEVFEGGVKPAAAGPVLRVTVAARGPLEVEGAMVVRSHDRLVNLAGGRTALCRCGQSRNKPFCDGTHQRLETAGP